ncbi:MAG: chemotaxis protein CheW [Actinomycetota bacterium]
MAAATFETSTKELNRQIGLTTDGSQFLTFQLGEELYGVDILRVQEIKGYTTVTKIPNTPPHIKGVLNLRGTIVPIIELRTKFGMPTIDYTMFTVIVVVVKEKIMGLVVDAVSDVLDIDRKDIQPPPEFGAKWT